MTKNKNKNPSKELPLGFVDRQEKELLVRDFIISNIKEIMIKYGFQYLETPSFEYSDSIGKFLPDKERPDEGVFSFKDENNWLSLRYDLTAPLARYVAKNYLEIQKPFKRYQLGTVWRNEKPGPGRFREFLQFDADFVGTKSLQADAELCVMISEILEKCGLTKSEYIVKISSRKITEELFKKIDLKENQQKLTTLRALDKIDRLGWDGVKELLGAGRKDKSGDFTIGANLKSKDIETIEETLKKKTPETEDLIEIFKIFKDYNFNNFEFDPSIIRGLEYYTGAIFEVNLKFDITNKKGQVIQFGSIGGGGRYDNLVNNFGNFDAAATGISIGLDRLVYALMQKKKFKIKQSKPIVICVFEKNSFKEYIKIQTILRKAGISVEIYPGDNKLKKQMEYANKIKSPAVILYGEDEIKSGKPTLRNLKSGKEQSIKINQLVNEIKKII
ncbi:histidine--tRNA ligase [Candidatus Pelagibacter communis]|uniref:histidine--tRNA ligase n=1 Tax=Pelagibacter ubique TaxID=198252 RepID=UPI00094DAA39|nr:histidine--tRNA ligase [Candidatus Pelagibacter ubique]